MRQNCNIFRQMILVTLYEGLDENNAGLIACFAKTDAAALARHGRVGCNPERHGSSLRTEKHGGVGADQAGTMLGS